MRIDSTPPELAARVARPWLRPLILVAVPALVFANTLRNGYHLDDFYRIVGNPELERVRPIGRHFTDPRTSATLPQLVQYRPLLPLSLSANHALSDVLGIDRLVGLHLGNVAIHAATGLWLYALFRLLLDRAPGRRLDPARRQDAAFAGALLFAVHPVAGVPVNYLAARDLLLMQLFLVGSLFFYARMRLAGGSPLGWAPSLLLLALSLLSKTDSAIAFAVVLLFEILLLRSSLRSARTWGRVAAFGVVTLSFFAFTEHFLGFSDAEQLLVDRSSALEYPLTQLALHLTWYARNFVWPFRMRPQPDVGPAAGPLDPWVLMGAVLVIASAAAAVRARRSQPLLSFCIGAYWLLFTLTSSVFPLRSLATDYRQYPSLAFLCFGLALAGFALGRIPVVRLALACRALYFAASAAFLNRIWKTEESLWEHTVRLGGNALAHMNYGLSVRGRDPDLAERHYREALRLHPGHVYAQLNLGLLLVDRARADEGLELIQLAVTEVPSWAIAHSALARALRQIGRSAEALNASRRAAELDWRNAEYLYEAAWYSQAEGQVEASLDYLRQIRERHPGYRDSLFLEAFALQSAGRHAAAIDAYREFLELRPEHSQARFNLAYALMVTGANREAAEHFQRVLELRPEYAEVHAHLAECLERLGDPERAELHRKLHRERGAGENP